MRAAPATLRKYAAAQPMTPPPTIATSKLAEASRGAAHALGGRREERDAEGRVGPHEVEEHVTVHREERAIGLGHRVRRARRLVDQRHLAEYAAGPDALDHRAAD